MASFFEKLIGGETSTTDTKQEKPKARPATKKEPKVKASLKLDDNEERVEEKPVEEEKEEVKAKQELKPPAEQMAEKEPEKKKMSPLAKIFPPAEGQLAIDVFQTPEEIIVQSAIGGIKPSDLEVTIENNMLQIKGSRQKQETIEKENYFLQECYWGSFSRQFVLPVEVDSSRAQAALKDGVLTVKIPKIKKEKVTRLLIKD